MASWDEQFDFDDIDSKAAPKKAKQQKKSKMQQDQFFDLDDQVPAKVSKLPVINKKPVEVDKNISKNQKKSKNIYDDYEQIYEEVQEPKPPVKNITKKQPEEDTYYEELESIEEPKQKAAKQDISKNSSKIINKKQDQEEFYQSLEDIKPLPKETKKVQPPSKKLITNNPPPKTVTKPQQSLKNQESYQENFDDYGQDFEEQPKKQQKIEPPKKSNTNVNLKTKEKKFNEIENKVTDKHYPITTNKVFTNKEIKETKTTAPVPPKPPQKQNKGDAVSASKKTIQNKPSYSHGVSQPPKPLQKSLSRKSLKSNESRSNAAYSRVTKKNLTQFPPNRHTILVEKSFPDDQATLHHMNMDKLNRINQQVRDMIRKFNDELNQLINKNMILLKEKPAEKQRNVEQKIRILEEQLKSGGTALDVVQNQYEKLKGRQGQLKEEQYQLLMERRIEQAKDQIKEASKFIVKLKFEMNNDGNKLSKQQIQKKMSQELHQIKGMLIQVKKEEQKNETRLQKLDKMIQELDGKNNDKEYQLSEQIDTAKQKGINLTVKQQLRKKHEQLKLKISTGQNHKRCIESLNKNKCDIINHQNDQIRTSVKNIQSQINNMLQSIEHQQEQSIKLIKKTKQNNKISSNISQTLDKILKSIQDNQNLNYYQVRTEGNKSQASQRPLKTSMYENISKEKTERKSASKKQIESKKPQQETHPDQINLLKPNFMKKKDKNTEPLKKPKQKEEEQTNKLYQRVWSEQEEQAKKRQEDKKKEEEKRRQQQKKKQVVAIVVEEQKKKPFTIKKNRTNNQQQRSFEATPETIKTGDQNSQKLEISPPPTLPLQTKQQQKPAIGPRMMRFNKRQRNSEASKTQILPPKQEVKQVKANIIEEPKLETKKQVQQQEQPAFVPKRFNMRNKIQKKQESYVPTIQVSKKEEKPEPVKQYAPNFSFKEENPYKSPIEGKKIENQVNIDVPEEKPKFTLRLRDRQKKENIENADYIPSRITQVNDTKFQKQNDTTTYNPSISQPKREQKSINVINKQKEQDTYQPTFKRNINQPENDNNYSSAIPKQNAPKQMNNFNSEKAPANNPYVKKSETNYNPSVPEVIAPVNNPYAPKEEAQKREKQGPVKKIKVQNKVPKQKFNIYDQAQDITQPVNIPASIPAKQPESYKPPAVNLAKTDQLDLNAMLGIKKKEKTNDLDDLLGQVKVEKKKDRKKNNDFFNDLEL